jgi:hypothetical protein
MFPPELHITVFDNDSRQGISGLALKLILFARRKNDYTIPMVTNSAGEVHLSVEYVRQSIKDDWELFPMDYESPLEECSGNVEIKVCTLEDVQRTILAMKMFRSASTISDELIEAFESSSNEQYIPLTARFNIEDSNKITIGIYSRLSLGGNSKSSPQ